MHCSAQFTLTKTILLAYLPDGNHTWRSPIPPLWSRSWSSPRNEILFWKQSWKFVARRTDYGDKSSLLVRRSSVYFAFVAANFFCADECTFSGISLQKKRWVRNELWSGHKNTLSICRHRKTLTKVSKARKFQFHCHKRLLHCLKTSMYVSKQAARRIPYLQ